MRTSRTEQLRLAARVRRLIAARTRVDALPDEARAEWQEARLAELRRHASARSPLYRRLHRGLDGEPLEALPTVTKDDLVERFQELVTDPALSVEHLRHLVTGGSRDARALGRYRIGMTSGSSGRPGLLAFDHLEWAGIIANAARARRVTGPPPVRGRLRAARVGSPSPWHLSRQVPATLHDPRKPSLTLSAASDVAELADTLQRWRPDTLSGYPSVLAALAQEQLTGRLAISPAQVFSGGEPLTTRARHHITAAWGVEPFDQYLTTEAGFVAVECGSHDGLHVLDDHVVVEVVDGAGGPVPAGVYGERVLLSVLGSRTLPLIRYELDDAAAMAEGPCPCGRRSPRLLGVAGQPRELLRFRGRGGGTVTIHPVVVTAVLDATPIEAWQVVQQPDRLRVLVVRPSASFAPRRLEDRLVAALVAAGARAPLVEVETVPALIRSGSGKASLVLGTTSVPIVPEAQQSVGPSRPDQG